MERPAQRANAARAQVEVATTDTNTVSVADDIPAQLRRRREASLRLPPLAGGMRDPWLVPRPPLSVASARAAWLHLYELGLMSETVDRVLRDSAREAAA
ncbi:MAG: hypothetical protein M3Q27_11750 [Actinomycetota bacterium]|nr:hypothetical protein [Actinomycetota bacterium]